MAPHLSKPERASFNKIVRDLKEKFPVAYPISIKTVNKLPGYYAKAELKTGRKPYFLITIRRDKYDLFLENFSHEYAHLMAWDLLHTQQDNPRFHNENWGICYSKIYSFLMDNEDDIAGKCNFKPPQ